MSQSPVSVVLNLRLLPQLFPSLSLPVSHLTRLHFLASSASPRMVFVIDEDSRRSPVYRFPLPFPPCVETLLSFSRTVSLGKIVLLFYTRSGTHSRGGSSYVPLVHVSVVARVATVRVLSSLGVRTVLPPLLPRWTLSSAMNIFSTLQVIPARP